MKHDWIIDVLTDLRQYALSNYCLALAEQLDDAIVIAAEEAGRADLANETRAANGPRRAWPGGAAVEENAG